MIDQYKSGVSSGESRRSAKLPAVLKEAKSVLRCCRLEDLLSRDVDIAKISEIGVFPSICFMPSLELLSDTLSAWWKPVYPKVGL